MNTLNEIQIASTEIKEAFLKVLNSSQQVLDEIKLAIESEQSKTELEALTDIQAQISAFHQAISRAENVFVVEEKTLDQTNPEKMLKQMNDLLTKIDLNCREAHFAILYPEPIEPDEDDYIWEHSIYLLITLKKKQILLACLPKVEKANMDIYAIYMVAKALLESYIQKRTMELVKDLPSAINETELQGFIESLLNAFEKVKKIYDEVREYAELKEQKITQHFIAMERRIENISAQTLPLLQTLTMHWVKQLGTRELLEKHIAFIKEALKKLAKDEVELEPEYTNYIKESIVKLEKELAKLPKTKSVSSYYDYLYVPDFFRIPWLSTLTSVLPAIEATPSVIPQSLGQKM